MRQPLVFVPGLLLTDDFWREQVARLSGDAQCIVPSGQYHMASVIDMARAVLDEAPDRFATCGLSMGGYICHETKMGRASGRVRVWLHVLLWVGDVALQKTNTVNG